MKKNYRELFKFIEEELNVKKKSTRNYLVELIEKEEHTELFDFITKDQYKEIDRILNKRIKREEKIKFMLKDENYNINFDEFAQKNFLENPTQDNNLDSNIQKITENKSKQTNFKCLDLPIKSSINDIITSIDKNRITLINGSTGCGKSTQIPKLLLNNYEKIICSQPRRISTVKLYKRIQKEILDEDLNFKGIVGYKIKFDENITNKTRLEIVTDGILFNKLSEKLSVLDYDVIIIDEVHERKIYTELFLSVIKFLIEKTKIKFVLMSATFDNRIIEYFQIEKNNLIKIDTKMFKVEMFYFKFEVLNYLTEIYKIIESLLANFYENKSFIINSQLKNLNILVFLPGISEIKQKYEKLLKLKKNKFNFDLYKIHSSLDPISYCKVFTSSNIPKIILSTNITETGLTIPNLNVVIDSGFQKENFFDEKKKTNILRTIKISKQASIQRAGRVGRISDGFVFRIYSEKQFNELKLQTPEILRTDFSEILFKILGSKIFLKNFRFLEKIDRFKLEESYLKLNRLGILGENIFKHCKEFRIKPEYSKMMVIGKVLGCEEYICKIIAVIISKKNKNLNFKENIEIKRNFESLGDFNLYLNYFYNYPSEEMKFNYKQNMAIVSSFIVNLKPTDFFKKEPINLEEKIKNCIFSSLNLNIAVFDSDKNFYVNQINNIEVLVHPSSVIYKTKSKIILYDEVIETSNSYTIGNIIILKEEVVNLKNLCYKIY